MKSRWWIVVVIVIIFAIGAEVLKSEGNILDDYFKDSFLYLIFVTGLAKGFEILWDYIKDDIKDYFRRKKNREEDNKRIEQDNKPDIDKAITQLRNIMFKKSLQYIDRIEDGEIKYIEKLNWRTRINENKYVFKTGTLFDVVDNYTPKGVHGLILIGYPGVGKTSSLFSYIYKTINEFPDRKIPVHFSLSLWTKDQSINDWMITELEKNYSLKGEIFRYLVDKKCFLPVFDALDQVHIDFRYKCVERIIDYADTNPIILTCRPDEFKAIDYYFRNKEILLSDPFNIFELRPLKNEQVNDVLNNIKNTDAINFMIKSNGKFSEIVTYPMLLYIIVTIRNKIKLEELEFVANQKNVYDTLWRKYDEYIFSKEGINSSIRSSTQKKISYKEDETRFWLHQLAKQDKTIIFIEDLQPKYLSDKNDLIFYYFFSRVACTVFLSIGVGLFLSGPFDYIGAGIISGCVITLITLILRGIILRKHSGTERSFRLSRTKTVLLFYASSVIVLVLFFGFSSPRKPEDMRFFGLFAITEANVGLFMALFVGVTFGLREHWYKERDVKPVEKLSINWKQFIKFGLSGGLLLGLFLIVCSIIVLNIFPQGTFAGWVSTVKFFSGTSLHQWTHGFIDIFVLCILASLVFGFPLIGAFGILNQDDLSLRDESKRQKDRPNYGIRESLRNLLRGSVPAGLIMMLMYGSFFWLLTHDHTCSLKGMKAGLGASVIIALWFGGFDVIQHFVLRAIIYLRQYGPWNFVKFMAFAARLRFVKPAGSSYEFVHDTLFSYFQDHFEDKKTTKGQFPFFASLILLVFLSVFIVVKHRTDESYFWKDEYGFVYDYLSKDLMLTDSAGKIISCRTGVVQIRASGSIYAGSFSGYVHPEGTQGGFLGFPIGNAYNIHKDSLDRHSALMVRTSSKKKWVSFYNNSFIWNSYVDRNLSLNVAEGDTIEFEVNDSEYHNNSGRYHISMNFADDTKLVIGHRGATGTAPENSLSAIRLAIANKHLNFVEFDVRMTKDGKLVLMHDKDINRTTNGKGLVKDLSYKEIQKFFISNPSIDSSQKENVPTLDEVLNLVKSTNVKLLIDVKDPNVSPDFGHILSETITKYELIDRIEIFSFNKAFLKDLKNLNHNLKTGLFVLGPIDYKDTYGVNIIGVHYFNLYLFPSFIDKLHRKNLKVYLWTVNSPSAIKSATQSNVDGIISDFPSRVQDQLISNKSYN